MSVFLTTSIIIGSVFVYFYWRSKKENSACRLRFNFSKQTTNY